MQDSCPYGARLKLLWYPACKHPASLLPPPWRRRRGHGLGAGGESLATYPSPNLSESKTPELAPIQRLGGAQPAQSHAILRGPAGTGARQAGPGCKDTDGSSGAAAATANGQRLRESAAARRRGRRLHPRAAATAAGGGYDSRELPPWDGRAAGSIVLRSQTLSWSRRHSQ